MSERKQYESLDAFLSELPQLADGARDVLRGTKGCYLLKTTVGRAWQITLNNGQFDVCPPEAGAIIDCTATVDDTVLLNIINGKASAVKALITRKIRAEGDIGKLMPLLRML